MRRRLPTRNEVVAEQCRRSLRRFIREAWPEADPAPYQHNWHIDAIADHLEAVTRGDIKRLLICVPPGHAKSLLVSVLWPAWVWIGNPAWRYMASSHSDRLVMRDSVRCRSLLDTRWYQESFRPAWKWKDDQNTKGRWENTQKGFRISHSVGTGTGDRGDAILVDDPLEAINAYSEPARRAVIEWWTQTMPTRLNDRKRGAIVIIQQRLHEDDLAGHVIREGGYDELRLPSRFEVASRARTSIGWEDPRQAEGELLFPEKFPKEVIDSDEKTMGDVGFPGQHQQRPSPAEGGMFKLGWWRFWRRANEPEIPQSFDRVLWRDTPVEWFRERTVVVPDHFDEELLSWDCAFRKTADTDFVCGGHWGRLGADKYLLDDLFWERASFVQTCAAIAKQAGAAPHAHAKLVEAKANGDAVIDLLKTTISGLIGVEPEGGKEARAAATSPQVQAGNVLIPLHAPWRDRYVAEHAAFPRGSHDDACDMQSQALTRWIRKAIPYGGQPENLPRRRV